MGFRLREVGRASAAAEDFPFLCQGFIRLPVEKLALDLVKLWKVG
jgi:hypothetical protein